ncbi:MAG: 3-hydroxyacyl-CoA dehydrogenase NAD-binding domain-containing protein [Pseudomonadota bacterium]
MSRPVTVQSAEGISVLTIDHPPVNALKPAVLTSLSASLAEAISDDDAKAIVIAARGKTFPAGIDIRDFDDRQVTQALADLCVEIEGSPKPVIVALHGTVLGGGLELALAAHYRFADRRASFAMPDVTLGLSPGAGGTQRLPRLVGAAPAIDLLLTGRRVEVDEALELGLIDEVADGPLPIYTMKQVSARLRKDALECRPTAKRMAKLTPPKVHLEAIEAARGKLAEGPVDAPGRLLDCIQASLLLPFEAGLTFERSAFDDLLAAPESRSLRHVFVAERRTRTPPLDEPVEPKPIKSLGVMGGGLVGAGIAIAGLDAGLPVTLVEANIEGLEATVETIIDVYDRQVKRGRLDDATRDARMARLTGTTEAETLSRVDAVIETTPEDPGGKRRAFTTLDAVMKPGALLATNTASLDIDGLAGVTGRADNVVGLHFFPPPHVVRLVEVVVATNTSDQAIATAFALSRVIGKTPIAAGVGPGYVADRVQGAYLQAAEYLVEDGASVPAVDRAMRAYGFPMGPFQMADFVGLDMGIARRLRYSAQGARVAQLPDRLMDLGRLGRRSGKGYYLYAKEGPATMAEDPELSGLVSDIWSQKGGDIREFSADDIQRRCLAAMANEAARIMEDGVAQRPSDIDVAMILAYGFPRWKGGPAMAADLTGILRVKRDLDAFAVEDAGFWTPSPLISDLVKNGQRFADLNDV